MELTEHAKARQKRRELLITVSFTLFCVLMSVGTINAGWPAAIVAILMAEMGFVWWAYVTRFQDYVIRAMLVTMFASLNILIYGVNAENFMGLIPTLCVFAVLFSMCRLRPAMDFVAGTILLLLIYHAFIEKTFDIPKDTIGWDRMILQLISLAVLIVLCFYNIRRSREEDEDVAELERRADRAQKIKDDFVANTSHELRTPINTISGMSEIILQKDIPESVHNDVLDIQMTSIELQTLVADVLDYAALESDTLKLSPRTYNITSTLNDVMNMTVFSNRDKNLELIFDCDPGIPRALFGDEQQLRRVLNDLIGNAIKFTSEGGVTVRVGYRKEEYGVNLIVTVKDTGIGMSEEEQERIFSGFYQVDRERNRRAEGMGLGLTITSALIKKMGGFMTVRSRKGAGSEFSFSVPQKVMDDAPCMTVDHPDLVKAMWYYNAEESSPAIRDDYIESINHIASHLGITLHRASTLTELKRRIRQLRYSHLIIGNEEYSEDPLWFDDIAKQVPTILIMNRDMTLPESSDMYVLYKPYNAMTMAEVFNGGDILAHPRKNQGSSRFVAPEAKVLVVDDNIMNLKVVEGLLRKYSIKVTAASSGEEALSQVESKDCDIIFMDHMMPGMDGIECMHRIREKQGSYYGKVPIVALTANAIAGSKEMFLEEGFDDFVAKPIDNAVLEDVLRKYIPDSKQMEVEDAGDGAAEDAAAGPSGFREMPGIDMETALAYCGGSLEDYVDLARVYHSTGEKYLADIKKNYEEKDWKNYAIIVHALKSTSKTIGAEKLSEIAYKEEIASKEEDTETIEQYQGPLLKEYRRVLKVLGENPRIVEKKERIVAKDPDSMSAEAFEEMKEKMRDALETFEIDSVSAAAKKYAGRSYEGERIETILDPVLEKAENFDFDGAKDELEKAGGERK